jgi:hypothetical protein
LWLLKALKTQDGVTLVASDALQVLEIEPVGAVLVEEVIEVVAQRRGGAPVSTPVTSACLIPHGNDAKALFARGAPRA